MNISRSEAKRLIKQGAVEIDGVRVTSTGFPISSFQMKNGFILKVGKRSFIRVINTDEKGFS